jgi:AcrR family transcriptional regulator
MATHDYSEPTPNTDAELDKQASAKSNGNLLVPVTARGEATRRRILDAAEAVFGELGYYEASISEITRRAGVAQGTFYIYFHSKREVFAELVEDLGKSLRAAIRTATAEITDRLEMERRGFTAFFEFVSTHRRIYRIVQEAERVAPEAAHAYYHGVSSGYIRGLQSAMEAGTIRSENPEAIAYALMGISHFVALRWIVWPQEGDEQEGFTPHLPDEIFASVMDFIFHGLAKPQNG